MVQGSGKRYDPAIVAVLVELLGVVAPADAAPAAVCETPGMAGALQVGMVLSCARKAVQSISVSVS